MPGFNDVPSFDTYISYPIAEYIVPFLRKTLDLTPNSITIINFVLRILLLYYYYNKQKFDVVVLLGCILTHIIDCFDGTMARKYDMGTPIGKDLDFYSDIIFLIILIIMTFKIYKASTKFSLIFMGVFIFFLSIYRFLFSKFSNVLHYIELNMGIIWIIIFFVLRNKK